MELKEKKASKDKINKIITIILVGLLLLIVVVPFGDEGGNQSASQDHYYEEIEISGGNELYYEERLKAILEKSYGTGTMEVMIHMKESEDTSGIYGEEALEVDGILIVADVDSEADVGDITFAVCALFDLPAHKVAVIKK